MRLIDTSDYLLAVDWDNLLRYNVTRGAKDRLRRALHNNFDFQDLHIMNEDTFILNYIYKAEEYSLVISEFDTQRVLQHYMINVIESQKCTLIVDFKAVLGGVTNVQV